MSTLIDPTLSETDNIFKLINNTVFLKYGITINNTGYDHVIKRFSDVAKGDPKDLWDIVVTAKLDNPIAENRSNKLTYSKVNLSLYEDMLIEVNGYQLGDIENLVVSDSVKKSVTDKMLMVPTKLLFEWLPGEIVVDPENGYKSRKVKVSPADGNKLYYKEMTLTMLFGLIDINVTNSGELVLVSDEYRVSNVFKTNGQYVMAPTYNDISSLKVKEGMLLYKTNYTLITIPNPKGLLYRIPGY